MLETDDKTRPQHETLLEKEQEEQRVSSEKNQTHQAHIIGHTQVQYTSHANTYNKVKYLVGIYLVVNTLFQSHIHSAFWILNV